jgi:hypothetical protein
VTEAAGHEPLRSFPVWMGWALVGVLVVFGGARAVIGARGASVAQGSLLLAVAAVCLRWNRLSAEFTAWWFRWWSNLFPWARDGPKRPYAFLASERFWRVAQLIAGLVYVPLGIYVISTAR